MAQLVDLFPNSSQQGEESDHRSTSGQFPRELSDLTGAFRFALSRHSRGQFSLTIMSKVAARDPDHVAILNFRARRIEIDGTRSRIWLGDIEDSGSIRTRRDRGSARGGGALTESAETAFFGAQTDRLFSFPPRSIRTSSGKNCTGVPRS